MSNYKQIGFVVIIGKKTIRGKIMNTEKLQNIIDRLVSMERYLKRMNNDLYNYESLIEDDKASLRFEHERFLKNLTWLRIELAELRDKEGKNESN